LEWEAYFGFGSGGVLAELEWWEEEERLIRNLADVAAGNGDAGGTEWRRYEHLLLESRLRCDHE